MIILIMGLPGSGKTTLAKELVRVLAEKKNTVTWVNADVVRSQFNDWDFSEAGRVRQAIRMAALALDAPSRYTVVDFIAPTEKTRSLFDANYTVWMDTITEGRYEDTNKLFEIPAKYNYRVTSKDATMWAELIVNNLRRT